MGNTITIFNKSFSAKIQLTEEEFPRKFFSKWSEGEQAWFIGYSNNSKPTTTELLNSKTMGYGKSALDAVVDLERLLKNI